MSRMIDVDSMRAAIARAWNTRREKLMELEYEASAKGMYLLQTKQVCDLKREMVALVDLWKMLKEVCGDE